MSENRFPQLKKDATIGELYDPLIQYAIADDETGLEYLEEVIDYMFSEENYANVSIEEVEKTIRTNLDYWCQYYSEEAAKITKNFYGLGEGFMDLTGVKHTQDLTLEEIFELGKKHGEESKRKTTIINDTSGGII
jgi:hypothetical protein